MIAEIIARALGGRRNGGAWMARCATHAKLAAVPLLSKASEVATERTPRRRKARGCRHFQTYWRRHSAGIPDNAKLGDLR
jgi:hypothetical protein